jgi:hypothetical protein
MFTQEDCWASDVHPFRTLPVYSAVLVASSFSPWLPYAAFMQWQSTKFQGGCCAMALMSSLQLQHLLCEPGHLLRTICVASGSQLVHHVAQAFAAHCGMV